MVNVSLAMMNRCWPVQTTPTAKFVLMTMADRADDDTGYCYASIDYFCERTCLGRTAVINALALLEKDGLLVADRSNGRRTKYWLKAPEPVREADRSPVREANRSATQTGPRDGPNQYARRTEPVREADTIPHDPSLIPPTPHGSHGVPARKKSKGSRRGTRLSIEVLPDAWRQYCEDKRPDLHAENTFEKFRTYWIAKPGKDGLKLDWEATWRNWVITERQTTKAAAAAVNGRPAKASRSESIADHNARLRAQLEAEGDAIDVDAREVSSRQEALQWQPGRG